MCRLEQLYFQYIAMLNLHLDGGEMHEYMVANRINCYFESQTSC